MTSPGAVWTFTTGGTPNGSVGNTPFRGTPWPVPGTIQAEDYDDGGQSVAYFDTAAGTKGGVYRTDDVDIQATSDADGAYNVGWTKAGEWLKYTVAVGTTATYQLEMRVAQLGTGTTFHVEVDSVDKTGRIAVPDTGGWQTFTTLTIPGISMTAGAHVVRLVFDTEATGGAGNYNWFRFSAANEPPVGGGGGGSTPFRGTPWPVPGTIQAEDYDNNGQSVAYFDTSAGNKGGVYRTDDVDIQTTSDADGAYNLGWTKAGEWLKYTVAVNATDNYDLEVRVAQLGTGTTFHVEVDTVDKTGRIAVPDTGGWQVFKTLTIPGVSMTAGTHVVRLVFDTAASGGAGNYNWLRFSTGDTPTTPTANLAWQGTPAPLPGIVHASNFDTGGDGVSYHDTSAGNSGGQYRTDTAVDIATNSDPASNGFYLGWARVGEWVKYTVNAQQSRTYAASLRVANLGSGATFRLEVDGTAVTGNIALPNTGAWTAWATLSLGGISLSQGQHVIRIVMVTSNVENNGVGNYGFLQFQ